MIEAQQHTRRKRARLDWWEEKELARKAIPAQLARILELLKKIQPTIEEFDVVWPGPCYIRGVYGWQETHFSIYQGKLFAGLDLEAGWHRVQWPIGANEVKIEGRASSFSDKTDEAACHKALIKVEERLKAIVADFAAYNQWLEERLPRSYRIGRIQRRLTWPKNIRLPISAYEIAEFENVMRKRRNPPRLKSLTLEHYLEVAAIAYDAVYEELRDLSPLGKYKARADGRHGGLLDLPPCDAAAFTEWFEHGKASGSHPWEIVFATPCGIILRPCHDRETGLWHYSFGSGSEGLYVKAARMAMALAEHRVPFKSDWKAMLATFRGLDEVEVGSGMENVHYEEIKQHRPDSLRHIRWEPLEHFRPMTAKGLEQVNERLKYEPCH